MLCETAMEPPWEPPGWTNCNINMCYSIFNLMYMVLWQSHLQPDVKEYWQKRVLPSKSRILGQAKPSRKVRGPMQIWWFPHWAKIIHVSTVLKFHLIAQGLWQVDALSQGMTSTLPFRWTFQTCWGGAKLLAYQWNQMVTSYWNTLDAFCRSDRVVSCRNGSSDKLHFSIIRLEKGNRQTCYLHLTNI